MSNASCTQAQGSSLLLHAPDGSTLNPFYKPGKMGAGDMTPGTPGGKAGGGRNRALQEYQMQLMPMEQQNKKELIARQDTSGLPRNDGVPGDRGGQWAPGGLQPFQRPALQWARPGASPNTADQMKRGTQQMSITGMGSHLPENCRSRSYPNSHQFHSQSNKPQLGAAFLQTRHGRHKR